MKYRLILLAVFVLMGMIFTLFPEQLNAQNSPLNIDPSIVQASGPSEATAGVLENTAEEITPQTYSGLQAALDNKMKLREIDIFPNDFETLFFTFWQHSLLQDAKQRFNTADPNEADPFGEAAQTNFIRELNLGGITYFSESDWTVWLNGKRVTPEAIPQQVIDMRVSDNYIDLKWFDGQTKIIYPVRLRPHERFNLDARMFMTGISPDQ